MNSSLKKNLIKDPNAILKSNFLFLQSEIVSIDKFEYLY